MKRTGHRRRDVIAGALALMALPAAAEEVIDLGWDDLLPDGGSDFLRTMRDLGVVEHDQLSTGFEQPVASGVTTAFNGRIVRLPGFVVPLEYSGTGVTAFVLVPYVGACIHVPPPPANQLVLVTTSTPYEVDGLFDPVTVEGMFGTAATRTELADIGYALSAERIEPYRR